MVKIHPQHSLDPPVTPAPPPPPPPPPPPRRPPARTPKQYCRLILQLSFCLCLILCFSLIILVVVAATMFGVRSEVDVRVTDVSLAAFVVNGTALFYDLAYNVTVLNPNRRIGVYYDKIKAFAFYAGELLAEANLPPFYQGHKSTNTLRAVFVGNKTVPVGHDFELFVEEKRSGVFSIVAAIAVTVRTKYGKIKYRHSPTYIDCYLRVPLSGKTSYVFETTRCGVVHIISYPNN